MTGWTCGAWVDGDLPSPMDPTGWVGEVAGLGREGHIVPSRAGSSTFLWGCTSPRPAQMLLHLQGGKWGNGALDPRFNTEEGDGGLVGGDDH